jgi:hypothetical protein
MKRICVTILIVAIAVLLIACDYTYVADGDDSHEFTQTLIEQIETSNFIEGIFVYGDRIFYHYYYPDIIPPIHREIVVVSMRYDGTDRRETSLLLPYQVHIIFDGRITTDGNIALILNYSTRDGESLIGMVSYVEFDKSGKIVQFSEVESAISENLDISRALFGFFTAEDEIVLYVPADGEAMPSLARIDDTFSITEHVHIHFTYNRIQANDGRIFYHEWSSLSLREVDFSLGTVSEPIHHAILENARVFSARAYCKFSFYVDDGVNLLGYCIDTKTATQLINWADVGLANHRFRIDFFQDGRIAIMATDIDNLSSRSLYVFTPVTQS